MRFIPPAGSPLKMSHILDSVRASVPSNGRGQERLHAIAARLEVKHIFGTSSGRAALWLALTSLHRLHPDRDVVAIPAYTCFSVPAAVVRAGLKIYPVEIDMETLGFNANHLAAVPEEKLLCIVPCNLFGFPDDVSAVREAARAKSAFVLDDAAQALGSTRDGRLAGTRGDIGIYSLGRGKSMGSVAGGLLVTNSDEMAATIQSERKNLGASGTAEEGKLLLKMVSYSLLIHPGLFWVPNAMPFLKLGTTEYEPNFPVRNMHQLSLALLEPLMDDLDRINHVRRENARILTERLLGTNFDCPVPGAGSQPTFVRFPVIARDYASRERAVADLRAAGIGATAFYPSAICDIAGIGSAMSDRDFHRAHAEELSRRLLTLPVHPFVRPQDIDRIVDVLSAA